MLKTVFKAVAFYCFELCTNAFINHYCHVYKGMQKGKYLVIVPGIILLFWVMCGKQ